MNWIKISTVISMSLSLGMTLFASTVGMSFAHIMLPLVWFAIMYYLILDVNEVD